MEEVKARRVAKYEAKIEPTLREEMDRKFKKILKAKPKLQAKFKARLKNKHETELKRKLQVEVREMMKGEPLLGFEYRLTDEKKEGKADYVISAGNAILLVIEAKATDLRPGIAQNLLQVRAAYRQNQKNGIDLGDTMYGLVTTASEWVLLKVAFAENDKCTVARCKDELVLSVKEDGVSEDLLLKQVEPIVGYIAWVLDNKMKKYRLHLRKSGAQIKAL
jgi:hypothetical protein